MPMNKMKKVVYIVPFSEQEMGDKLFLPPRNGDSAPPFDFLKIYLNGRGIEVHTIDFLNANDRSPNDVVIVFNYPPVGFYKLLYGLMNLVRRKKPFPLKNEHLPEILGYFPKKILMQWESPVNNPWVYRNISSIVSRFDKSLFVPKVDGFPHFYHAQNLKVLNSEYFRKPRKSFMVMMNNWWRAKGFWGVELYSERVRALEFFSKYEGEVDLYGGHWEASGLPFIKKIWRGRAENKSATISDYKFSLCFENSIWPGYVTEKIFDCFFAGTIPVYWGAPDIEEDVPADCFIDMRKFKDYAELRTFLRALTPREMEDYRNAIRRYLESPAFRRFMPEYFAETVFKVISE